LKNNNLIKNISILRLILIIFIVNAAGFLLRYFELPDYIILIGFRFHLAAVLPFLFIIKKIEVEFLIDAFRNPPYFRKLLPFLTLVIPVIITAAVLYFFTDVELNDPEYFYEFGLSSIVDFPLYLIWNIPQLIMLFVFLSVAGKSFINNFLILFFLFVYLFVPIDIAAFSYLEPVSFVLFILSLSIALNKFSSIYFFIIYTFFSLWIINLAFGTESARIVNLLFASRYDSWEGFFSVGKKLSGFIMPAFFFFSLIVNSLFGALTKKS